MGKKWEFFERLNEVVYVSNPETYELEYMNHKALELYGYSSLEEVKGKKCYEVLQNSSTPCDMCTNCYLKEGDFYEWQHTNPLIGKTYALKDTLVEQDGKLYRMELAIDMTVQEQQKQMLNLYMDNGAMINEGLRIALLKTKPSQAIETFLDYLGHHLKSERIYIFEEREDETVENTYEWSAYGVTPQKENLKRVPFAAVSLWYEAFKKGENVIIKDLEEVKDTDPVAYEYLKPQNIRTTIATPIVDEGKIIGFFGVDNVPVERLEHISLLLEIVGHFVVSLLKRRDLVTRLETLGFYDQLTGLKNRHAMDYYLASFEKEDSIGVLYFDIMGLKRVNDTLGHQEGDRLLKRAAECLRQHFDGEELFRIGGDEFLVLCKGASEEEIVKKIELLRKDMEKSEVLMAVGYEWQSRYKENFDQLLKDADAKMYEDKRAYYAKTGMDRRSGI